MSPKTDIHCVLHSITSYLIIIISMNIIMNKKLSVHLQTVLCTIQKPFFMKQTTENIPCLHPRCVTAQNMFFIVTYLNPCNFTIGDGKVSIIEKYLFSEKI